MPRAACSRLFFLLLLVASCHGEAEQAHRAEAARVAHVVENLRNAPNADKAPRLAELKRTACRVDDVCELKRVCVDAYRRQVQGLDDVRAVRDALAGDAGSRAVASAAELLRASQKEVSEARSRARRCADLEGALARRYGL